MNVCTFSETCFLDAFDKINVTHVSLLNIGLSSQRDNLKTGIRGKVRVGVNPQIAHLVIIGQPVSQDFFVNHVISGFILCHPKYTFTWKCHR